MRETLKDLKERRSIKKYKPEQIREEDLNEILEAGMNAPTGKGLQSPVMVVVQDPEMIRRLSKMNAAVMGVDMDPFYGAPTVVVVLADSKVPTYVQDASLVMGNLMNAAHALGLGSRWINRAREVFASEEGKEILKSWGLGEEYEGVGHCIIGYADGEYPKAAPRKENYVIRP